MTNPTLIQGKFPHTMAVKTTPVITKQASFPTTEKESFDVTKKLHQILQKKFGRNAQQ